MRILQIASLYPPHVGGIEKHVECLSKGLVESGHEVTVYTSNLPKSIKHEIVNGVEIYRFDPLCSPLNNQITPGIFLKMMGSQKFDVVHVHSHLHFSSNMAVVSNIFRKYPLVLTSHGTVSYEGWKELINKMYSKSLAKLTLKSANKIVALTPSQAEILIKLGADRDKLTVIPNGIDLKKFSVIYDIEYVKKFYGLENKKIILYVGGITPRKGIFYLIKAMEHIETDSFLLIVGGTLQGGVEFMKKLTKYIDEKKMKNIIFLGRLSDGELIKIYNIADLFVLPSVSEGLPLTLLEAMAYNRCILATNIPGNCDIIKNNKNGVLVEPRDSIGLAKKIDSLLNNDKLRRELGGEARKDIENRYDWNIIFDKILNIYYDVANLE